MVLTQRVDGDGVPTGGRPFCNGPLVQSRGSGDMLEHGDIQILWFDAEGGFRERTALPMEQRNRQVHAMMSDGFVLRPAGERLRLVRTVRDGQRSHLDQLWIAPDGSSVGASEQLLGVVGNELPLVRLSFALPDYTMIAASLKIGQLKGSTLTLHRVRPDDGEPITEIP